MQGEKLVESKEVQGAKCGAANGCVTQQAVVAVLFWYQSVFID